MTMVKMKLCIYEWVLHVKEMQECVYMSRTGELDRDHGKDEAVHLQMGKPYKRR